MQSFKAKSESASNAELCAIPLLISQQESWPWWRRLLNVPPKGDAIRMNAWFRLISALASVERTLMPKVPGTRRPGIFYESIVLADFLQSEGEPFTLDGSVMGAGSMREKRLACPTGALAFTRRIKKFAFDITEIDGIASSKSSDRAFSSVSEFGLGYVTYKKESVDAAGLARMLDHREVRIVQPDTTDRVGIRTWDGRLFLYNAGGSHHFAGAHYIAGVIGQAVPLHADLQFVHLNIDTLRWLQDKFAAFAVPQSVGATMRYLTAQLLGCSYTCNVPSILSKESAFLFLPKTSSASSLVADTIEQSGLVNLAPWFDALISMQQANMIALRRRFPTISYHEQISA